MGVQNKVRGLTKSSLRMKLFLMKQLPLAFIAGLKVVEMDVHKSKVSVPFNYLTKNPFRSIYFAALSMAAELSTGILAMAAVYETGVPVSMLVLGMEADFVKKADSRVVFSCEGGQALSETIARSIKTGEGQTIKLVSRGYNTGGDLVASFTFNWTFKPKSKK